MRILHVQTLLAIGGVENMILQLAREQMNQGHDVTICCIYGEGPFDYRAAEKGIRVVHLNSERGQLARIRALYAFLGREKFDVLNSHWGVWLTTAIAGFLRGVPRVQTNHSNHSRRQFIEHRIACAFTTKVVSLTPYVEPYLTKWVGVPRRKIAVIPNGLDFSILEAASRVEIDGIPPEAPVIGMIARHAPPKDYSTFLKAAQIVNRSHPQVHFISIGEGPQRPQFEREAAELKLINFHFLGGRHDVPSLFRRMSLNVLATRNEGHPLTLVEAMASDCPSIASDIPSVRFTLDAGRAGVLVPGEDASALARAMTKLLDDPTATEALRIRGREWAKNFSAEKMCQNYLSLYASIIH